MNIENAKSLVKDEHEVLVETLIKFTLKWISEDPSNRLLDLKIINHVKFYHVKSFVRFENELDNFYFQYGLEDQYIDFSSEFKHTRTFTNVSRHANYVNLINELSSIIETHILGQKS